MPIFKNQTIVVPFDFSSSSIIAVHQVLDWADDSNAIHVVHVIVPMPAPISIDPPVWLPPELDIQSQKTTLENMKKLFESNDRLKLHSVIGDPGTQIVALAEKTKANVIVMPSHGRSGLSRLLLGSVAERVLRLAHCPVFVLRGERFEKDDAKVETKTVSH